jgi:hypothetical protein
MENEPLKNEVTCAKNCDSIIKECIVNGEDVLICGNTFNRCLSVRVFINRR